jgi:hypothetical protein
MDVTRSERMAIDLGGRLGSIEDVPFTASARYRGAGYGLKTLSEFGATFLPAVLRGEIGTTSIRGLARTYGVSDALVETFLQQTDLRTELNFVAREILESQAGELVRDVDGAGGDGRIVLARTQPTSPLSGVHVSYRGRSAFGLEPGRKAGAFDSVFATYASPHFGGCEQSVNLGGYVPALDKDRKAREDGDTMVYLSPIQRLSLESPVLAMFVHAGAVWKAIEALLSPKVSSFIFLKGRFEGFESSEYLSSPSHRVPIVTKKGYAGAARRALGDDVDILIEAEAADGGWDPRHEYVRQGGRIVSGEAVKHLMDRGLTYKLDPDAESVEHRGMLVLLMPGEVRVPLGGGRYEGGQLVVQVTQDLETNWFVLPRKTNGKLAWPTEGDQVAGLKRIAEDLAMLDASDSTAGVKRREQYEALEDFNVPMSNPCGRENVWRLAAARRQSGFPDNPVEVTPAA